MALLSTKLYTNDQSVSKLNTKPVLIERKQVDKNIESCVCL